MRIAILGWGSLLWDNQPDFDEWRDEWQYDGPPLKLEFSRISKRRCGALTLVIDEVNGASVPVAWCMSKRKKPEDARCDLRCREGTTIENIGHVVTCSAGDPTTSPRALVISAWARTMNLDAVVWTELTSNFEKKVNRPFNVLAAVAYLKELPANGKAKAAEYVWRAPDFVRTPLRSVLQVEPWFAAAK